MHSAKWPGGSREGVLKPCHLWAGWVGWRPRRRFLGVREAGKPMLNLLAGQKGRERYQGEGGRSCKDAPVDPLPSPASSPPPLFWDLNLAFPC